MSEPVESTTAAARAFGEAAREAAHAMRQFATAFKRDMRRAQGPLRLPNRKRERAK